MPPGPSHLRPTAGMVIWMIISLVLSFSAYTISIKTTQSKSLNQPFLSTAGEHHNLRTGALQARGNRCWALRATHSFFTCLWPVPSLFPINPHPVYLKPNQVWTFQLQGQITPLLSCFWCVYLIWIRFLPHEIKRLLTNRINDPKFRESLVGRGNSLFWMDSKWGIAGDSPWGSVCKSRAHVWWSGKHRLISERIFWKTFEERSSVLFLSLLYTLLSQTELPAVWNGQSDAANSCSPGTSVLGKRILTQKYFFVENCAFIGLVWNKIRFAS